MKPKELGQIFWLVIPLFAKKLTYVRPFLIYGTEGEYYILLKITNRKKEYLDQFEFSLSNKPTTLYNESKKSFVDPNILIYIKHDLFTNKLYETMGTKGQGQYILEEDFNDIALKVENCFNNEKFRGNRYRVRVE